MDKGFESAEICRDCKGACCKANGCSLAPEDMLRELEEWCAKQENTVLQKYQDALPQRAYLEGWLQESQCAIDSFTGKYGMCYYIRMRHKCFTFIGVDAMGECIALTDQGCSLSYERRPRGGRYLEGRPDRRCRQHYTREQMETDWKPYQPLLKEIWDRWHDRLEGEGVFEQCEEEYMRWQRERREQQSVAGHGIEREGD